MALTQASLATKIQTEIITQFGAAADASILNKFCQAIAKAVVDEIQQNAVVNPTALVAPQNAGPVTGTGTIS
jgi:hypothetical protein